MKQAAAKPPISREMALSRAMKLCSSQEYCRGDIEKKLISWQLDPQHIPAVLKELEKEHFLDDARFARAFAKDKLRFSKWGSIKVEYHLKMKGIPENIIHDVFRDLDDIDQEEIIRKELELKRKQIKDSDPYLVKMKLLRFAQSRGYDLEMVQRVVRLIC